MPDEQASAVQALARARGLSVSAVHRIAIAEYVDRCRLDREMQRRQQRAREYDWEVFELGASREAAARHAPGPPA
jgi:hypothetical protein